MKSRTMTFLLALCCLGMTTLMTSATSYAQVSLRFAPGDTVLEVGQPARLSIMCDEPMDLRTIEVFVEFDPTILNTLGGGSGALFENSGFNLFDGFGLSEPNVWHGYCVIMGAYDFITSPGELFYWEFEGIADGLSAIESISVGLAASDGTGIPEVTLAPISITIGNALTPVEIAPRTGLNLNCIPNPFNPMTRINFSLPEEHSVCLEILGIDGRVIQTLINETRGSGPHEVTWDGRNALGQVQASGMYFYRIQAGPYSQVRKMTLMK